jgi:two-component system chemotaxis response regulator CheB
VLSGVLDDGSAGLLHVKMHGGTTIAQDPEEALYPAMPQNAIEHVHPDRVLSVEGIASAIGELVTEPVGAGRVALAPSEAVAGNPGSTDPQPGEPSGFSCPECGGSLWESVEGDMLRFRCRVGHQFSADSLLAEQAEALDGALWSGLRALEERAALNRRLAERARERNPSLSARFERRADEADRSASVLRDVLQNLEAVEAVNTSTGSV